LKRVGISFTDAQAEVLKYGNESERASMLAQVITDNVGDMNAELAKTDSGKIKQAENDIGDMQEEIGEKLIPIQLQWVQLQKSALIPALGALFDVLGFIAKIVMAVVSAIGFVIEGFKGTNTIATILASALTAVGVVWGIMLVIAKASAIQTAIVSAAETIYIGLLYAKEAAMKVVTAAANLMGVSMSTALGIIGLVIIAVAALIAVLIAFASNPFSEEAKRIRDDLKAMNEEFEDGQKQMEAEAAASEKLADELIALSNKSNKTAADIASMQAKAAMLNETLGEGTVEVDKNTGAMQINGEAVDDVGKSLKILVAAKLEEAKATAIQEAATKAYTLQAEALANWEKVAAEANLRNADGVLMTADAYYKSEIAAGRMNGILFDSASAYMEASKSVDYYNGKQTDSMIVGQEVTQAAAEQMTEKQKQIAIEEELNADRELTTSEHYAKLQEMMSSNYAALGLTEEEYITQMSEHQAAIEEATQEHVDTLFGINEDGLYNEAQTVAELTKIWAQNQRDMANYYANLNTLSEAGFKELVWYFEQGGVETGGTLQNTMDALQGIGLSGWEEIIADWNTNGGYLSAGIKKKYGDVNVEAGIGGMKLVETAKKGFADAKKYGLGSFDPVVDGVDDIYDAVDMSTKTGGKEVAGSSAKAGEDASQSFMSAVRNNVGDTKELGKITGVNYVVGILQGLQLVGWALAAKAKSLAQGMNNAFKGALDIDSPSRVARWNSKMYGKGAELGLEDSKKGVKAAAADLANTVFDASRLVYTPPYMGSAGATTNNYNYYNSQTDSTSQPSTSAMEAAIERGAEKGVAKMKFVFEGRTLGRAVREVI
jgi:hypothetical protein